VLFRSRITASNVVQGSLGNCWLVAACSVLTCSKKFWQKVIPEHKSQDLQGDNYAGIVKFNFWKFGKWVQIVVDDRLPTINDHLIFTRSTVTNEFWPALLEKAYAKLNSSYGNLDGGTLSEALQDFTGGVCETIKLANYSHNASNSEFKSDDLFNVMKKSFERDSLMACAITATSSDQIEQKLSCGLIIGHAYAISSVKQLVIKENKFFSFLSSKKEILQMVRLNNPWGKNEWIGPWSDNSEEWKRVPKSERDKMGLTFDDDGEFWMELSDFIKYFSELSICRMINTSHFSLTKTWSESIEYGKWISPSRCGGCSNYRLTFFNNPQYVFEIVNSDVTKEEEILINLDQKSLRFLGKENHTIGFTVFKVEENRNYRLHSLQKRSCTSSFINTRSVFLRTKMSPGRYCIIPSTYAPYVEAEFLLRVYTDNDNNLRELTGDSPKPFLSWCFKSALEAITQVNVLKVKEFDTKLENANSYVIIKCEGKHVKSRIAKHDQTTAEFNTGAIFYRHKLNKPIIVQLWIKNVLSDELYGEVELKAEPNESKLQFQCPLIINSKAKNIESKYQQGRLVIDVFSTNKLKGI